MSTMAKNNELRQRIETIKSTLAQLYQTPSIGSALANKYDEFVRNWKELNELCDKSIANSEMMDKIKHMLNDGDGSDDCSKFELEGKRVADAFKDQADVNERVIKLVYKHLEKNAEIRNVSIY
jgi:hypothetical protein